MMESIDNALVVQFSEQVHVKAQQMRSRLKDKVTMRKYGPADVWAYDGLGDIEAKEIVGRVQPVEFSDMSWTRRKITRRRFALALPIDNMDSLGMLADPNSVYVEACVRAMERVFDRVVIGALFATVYTGREFATAVTAATDGVVTVDATAGLTYEKLLEIDQNFIDKEVGTDIPEPLTFGLAGDEHTALMQQIELTSGDYSRQYVVDKGRIQTAGGFNLTLFGGSVTNPMLTVTAGVRDCFAMTPRAVCMGISKEMSAKVESRPDYHDLLQVVVEYIIGAVRTEGVQVQKVQTTASA
jgi:hypothetical protein